MDTATANNYIALSAFVVAALYSWRWLTGKHQGAALSFKSLVGYQAPLVSPEGFVVAWGVVFLVLAILAAFLPALAGSLALLVLTGDVLGSGVSVAEGAGALEAAKVTQSSKGKK